MAKLNRFKALVLQDLTQLIPKKQIQNESIACFHNAAPTWRFWSFLEFSKRDGQYLNRTKENETYDDNVNFPEKLLAFPRTQMFQSAFGKNETSVQDSSPFNVNLKNLKTKALSNLECSDSGPTSKAAYKFSPSKSLTRIFTSKQNSNTALPLPMDATRLQRSKSFSNQIVSRLSSGIAKTRREIGLSMSKPGLSKPSIQIANMSSGSNGKRSSRQRKKSKNNKSESQECPGACPPPPPPPPCCPPPPPSCCPPPPCCEPPSPPKKNRREKRPKSKKSSSECPPPPPEPCAEMEAPPPPKECDSWCPVQDKGNCYKSKCPEKKKRPCPPIKPCPPRCFEPDPCEVPKAFCVGCPSSKKKKSNDRDFSTWTNFSAVAPFASRSFTSDRCVKANPEEETIEERFNKRFPKPGPACNDAKDDISKCNSTTIKV
ncbi:arp2/3 complex-activating protein rickA-like [Leptopilina heterotoma]|uniref:arp2/3 complex-activating protein rickA-like n=1 Tax=Leptopilina heterotoma TaxID=63436 RepID=UPI001CA87239|nr:arp2/3 complex-activating protein rickA-like [Leptopilina heterotoma]